MEAISFKTTYLRCIGERFIKAFNDTGNLRKIYKNLDLLDAKRKRKNNNGN